MSTKPILLKQLNIDPAVHNIISIVGAGGKTSLMKRLRKELTAQGLRVLVSTSTHILHEPDEPVSDGSDKERVREFIGKYGYAVVGRTEDGRETKTAKLAAIDEERLCGLKELCDVMLIEADGARGMRIKVPAEWEPVIYPWTNLVISVAGAGSIGCAIKDAAYRADDFAAFVHKDVEDAVSVEDVIRAACSEAGLRKGVSGRDYRFYLNAIDDIMAGPGEIENIIQRLNAEHSIMASYGSPEHIDETGAVILAAGLSTRFGSDKLKKNIGGKPVYMHVLDEMASVFNRDDITFVTGRGSLAEEAETLGVHVVINERPEEGISSSMKLGLGANMHKGSCMFAVADQPMIKSGSICALIEGYKSSDKCMASIVDGQGEFANPCIFSAAYYSDLFAISGDKGGKGIIIKHSDDVYTCKALSESELEDIDTIEDYERIACCHGGNTENV